MRVLEVSSLALGLFLISGCSLPGFSADGGTNSTDVNVAVRDVVNVGNDVASSADVSLNGLDANDVDASVLDVNVLDVDGLDVNGLDVNGLDVNVHDVDGLDVDGLDVDGPDANGLDVNVLDVNGLDVVSNDVRPPPSCDDFENGFNERLVVTLMPTATAPSFFIPLPLVLSSGENIDPQNLRVYNRNAGELAFDLHDGQVWVSTPINEGEPITLDVYQGASGNGRNPQDVYGNRVEAAFHFPSEDLSENHRGTNSEPFGQDYQMQSTAGVLENSNAWTRDIQDPVLRLNRGGLPNRNRGAISFWAKAEGRAPIEDQDPFQLIVHLNDSAGNTGTTGHCQMGLAVTLKCTSTGIYHPTKTQGIPLRSLWRDQVTMPTIQMSI